MQKTRNEIERICKTDKCGYLCYGEINSYFHQVEKMPLHVLIYHSTLFILHNNSYTTNTSYITDVNRLLLTLRRMTVKKDSWLS